MFYNYFTIAPICSKWHLDYVAHILHKVEDAPVYIHIYLQKWYRYHRPTAH